MTFCDRLNRLNRQTTKQTKLNRQRPVLKNNNKPCSKSRFFKTFMIYDLMFFIEKVGPRNRSEFIKFQLSSLFFTKVVQKFEFVLVKLEIQSKHAFLVKTWILSQNLNFQSKSDFQSKLQFLVKMWILIIVNDYEKLITVTSIWFASNHIKKW